MYGYEDDMNNIRVNSEDKDYYDEKTATIKDEEGNEHEIQIDGQDSALFL